MARAVVVFRNNAIELDAQPQIGLEQQATMLTRNGLPRSSA